jgi:hypothetical protein
VESRPPETRITAFFDIVMAWSFAYIVGLTQWLIVNGDPRG